MGLYLTSNRDTGQIQAEYWSNTGRILVEYWVRAPDADTAAVTIAVAKNRGRARRRARRHIAAYCGAFEREAGKDRGLFALFGLFRVAASSRLSREEERALSEAAPSPRFSECRALRERRGPSQGEPKGSEPGEEGGVGGAPARRPLETGSAARIRGSI